MKPLFSLFVVVIIMSCGDADLSDPTISSLCIEVFDPMCDDCIENLQIQLGEIPESAEACHLQLPDLCDARYGIRTTTREKFDDCRAEASCGRFEGDAPPTCEEVFTVD